LEGSNDGIYEIGEIYEIYEIGGTRLHFDPNPYIETDSCFAPDFHIDPRLAPYIETDSRLAPDFQIDPLASDFQLDPLAPDTPNTLDCFHSLRL